MIRFLRRLFEGYVGTVVAIWGFLEAYTYFRGDHLKQVLGPHWLLVYSLPILPALVLAFLSTRKDTNFIIMGNVLDAEGTPIQNASISVEGVNREKKTDSTGWFSIEVTKQDSWVVRASYKGRSAQATVTRRDVLTPVRLTLTGDGSSEGVDGSTTGPGDASEVPHPGTRETAVTLLQDLLGEHRTLVEDDNLLLFKGIAAGWSHLTSPLEGPLQCQPPRTYRVGQLLDLWRDVYGAEWRRDDPHPRVITAGTRLELRHVILHEYPSITPGFRYTVEQKSIRQMRESQIHQEGLNKANEFLSLFQENPRGVYESYRLHNYDYNDYLKISYHLIEHEEVGQEALKPFLYSGVHYFCRILDVGYVPCGDRTTRRHYLGATGGEREGSPASFPLIVGSDVYDQVRTELDRCGAARVKSIRGTIKVDRYLMPASKLTSSFFQTYRREPLVLVVDEGQSIQLEAIDSKRNGILLGDAWVIALIDHSYLVFAATFELGKEEWRQNLSQTCNWLRLFTEICGGVVISDFDAKNRPFSEAPIHPEVVHEWLRELHSRNLAFP